MSLDEDEVTGAFDVDDGVEERLVWSDEDASTFRMLLSTGHAKKRSVSAEKNVRQVPVEWFVSTFKGEEGLLRFAQWRFQLVHHTELRALPDGPEPDLNNATESSIQRALHQANQSVVAEIGQVFVAQQAMMRFRRLLAVGRSVLTLALTGLKQPLEPCRSIHASRAATTLVAYSDETEINVRHLMVDKDVAESHVEAMRGERAQIRCVHVISFDDTGEARVVVLGRQQCSVCGEFAEGTCVE